MSETPRTSLDYNELYRASTFEDISLFIRENVREIYLDCGGSRRGDVSMSELSFSDLKVFSPTGMTTYMRIVTRNIDSVTLMKMLMKCRIHATAPIHPNVRSAIVILRDDEWVSPSMHLTLLGLLDGSMKKNEDDL